MFSPQLPKKKKLLGVMKKKSSGSAVRLWWHALKNRMYFYTNAIVDSQSRQSFVIVFSNKKDEMDVRRQCFLKSSLICKLYAACCVPVNWYIMFNSVSQNYIIAKGRVH